MAQTPPGMKTCEGCGRPFIPDWDKPWARFCWPCFKAGRGRTKTEYFDPDDFFKSGGFEDFVRRHKEREERAQRERERHRRENPRPPPREPAGLSAELKERLPLLIRLCHPDKHDNSQSSNDITKWLLSLRKKL